MAWTWEVNWPKTDQTEKSIQIYLTQVLLDIGAFIGNGDPNNWQNLLAFILDWTKRGNCGKVTEVCGEAKERK